MFFRAFSKFQFGLNWQWKCKIKWKEEWIGKTLWRSILFFKLYQKFFFFRINFLLQILCCSVFVYTNPMIYEKLKRVDNKHAWLKSQITDSTYSNLSICKTTLSKKNKNRNRTLWENWYGLSNIKILHQENFQ